METQDKVPHMDIGKNIRRIRKDVLMTQQQLADACGLTKSMISKVESGAVVPALSTLTKIAHAMRVRVAQLIEPEEDRPSMMTLNPFADPGQFVTTAMGYRICNPAAGLRDKMTQPILVTAREGEVIPHMVDHPGEEYLFIFDGEMTFVVGEAVYLLRRGDSLFFDASQSHGIREVKGTVQYVDVFVGHHFEAPMKAL